MPDFPKTVGPDRQTDRTDDFKIYIRPNVRENCLNPRARKQKFVFLRHACLLYFYYLTCGELVFWRGLIKNWYRIGIVSGNTYRFMDRKRKYCDASLLI